TTTKQIQSYSERGKLFLDSLSVIGAGSLIYALVSLFSPVKFRLSSQKWQPELMQKLLNDYPATSEDFFKLWPPDKAYFFDHNRRSGLAYKATAGVALAVADPAGDRSAFPELLREFKEYCYVNDWDPAFVH